MPTERSYHAIILRSDISTSHDESENCYRAVAAEREVGHGVNTVVLSHMTQVLLFSFCAILRGGEILS